MYYYFFQFNANFKQHEMFIALIFIHVYYYNKETGHVHINTYGVLSIAI